MLGIGLDSIPAYRHTGVTGRDGAGARPLDCKIFQNWISDRRAGTPVVTGKGCKSGKVTHSLKGAEQHKQHQGGALMIAKTDPRVPGGRYLSGYWQQEYEVTRAWSTVAGHQAWIECAWQDGRVTAHCTPWDARRDKIITPCGLYCAELGHEDCW
jgi:hypothetical protein